MIRELQLRILPEQAASEQSIAAYVAREQSMDIRSIKSVRVLKRSIDARQRMVMVNLKVRVYIDEFPQDDEFPVSSMAMFRVSLGRLSWGLGRRGFSRHCV